MVKNKIQSPKKVISSENSKFASDNGNIMKLYQNIHFSQSSKILKVASSRNSSCAKIFGIFKVQSPKLSIFGHDGEFGGFGEFGMKSKSSKERRL